MSQTKAQLIDNLVQPITGALGSQSAPTFSFTADPNTGIYSPGADQVAISTGGSGKLFINSTGTVSIGTASPSLSSALEVYATAPVLTVNSAIGNPSSIRLQQAGTTYARFRFDGNNVDIGNLYSGGATILNAGNAERLRITSAGLVGVGTSSPSEALTVSGKIQATTEFKSETGNDLRLNAGSANRDIFMQVNGSTLMTVQGSTGRVGIGSSAPGYNLELAGSNPTFGIRTSLQSASSASTILFRNKDGNGNDYDIGKVIGATVGNGGYGELQFYTAFNNTLSQQAVLTREGRLGIGTTSPLNPVHIAAAIPIIRLQDTDGGRVMISCPDGHLDFEADPDQQVASSRISFKVDDTERARIDSSGRWLLGTSSARSNDLFGTSQSQVEGTDAATSSISIIRNVATTGAGGIALCKSRSSSIGGVTVVQSGDVLGFIDFQGADGTDFARAATIEAQVDGTPGNNDMPGRLVFSTTADGASSPTERMRIDSAGNLLLNATSVIDVSMFTANIKVATNFATLKAPDTNSYMAWQFQNSSGTRVGYIQFSTTATTFSTSSDYRLKENVTAVTDGIARLQQLKPSRFNFIADPDKTVDGFIAHEVQTVVPEAIQGEKDAVDADGNPIYQGIDQSKLVPLLTAALQEAVAEINALKDRVAALEGA